jgi:hypothetical protein
MPRDSDRCLLGGLQQHTGQPDGVPDKDRLRLEALDEAVEMGDCLALMPPSSREKLPNG